MSVLDTVQTDDVIIFGERGEAILHDVHNAIGRFVVLPSADAAIAVTLWVVATHAVQHFEHATRLAIHSPAKRCGKSRLLEVIAALVHEPLTTTNISVPALFRVIDKAGERPPTLILDEADRLLGTKKLDENNADLVAMLNNGFRRGSPTWRCVGPSQVPTAFDNFAMVAAAGIGRLPDTVEDRAVNITMRRRLPNERVSKFRLRTDVPVLNAVRDRAAEWAAANGAAIRAAAQDESSLPPELEDRAQDAWEPLLAIATVAGGDWPQLARTAAVNIAREAAAEDGDMSLDTLLLADIAKAFDVDPAAKFLSTAAILLELQRDDEAPWADMGYTARRLAMRLGRYGVKPVHNTARTERGYLRSDLESVWTRYLPSQYPSIPSEVSNTPPDQGERSDGSNGLDGSTRPDENKRPGVSAGQTPYRTERTLWTGTPTGQEVTP